MKPHRLIVQNQTLTIDSPLVEKELPGSVYVGGAEILAGALACILGTVFPLSQSLGVVLVGDGIRRVFNGLEQKDTEDRLNTRLFPEPSTPNF